MKKLLALLLAAVMCLGLVACGDTSSNNSQAPSTNSTAPSTESTAPSNDENTPSEPAAPEINWPGSEPVNFYVPGKAGGATDVAGRIIADYLAKVTGGTFVIMNEATGSGTVLCETIRTTGNPNYDIAILGSQNINAYLDGKYDYDVRDENEFTIISRVIRGAHANMLVCGKDAPFHTYEEFVEYGLAHPGEIRISATTGSLSGLYVKMICENAGIEYRMQEAETSDAVVNVLGGISDCFVSSYSVMESYDGTGELFPLVTIDLEREEAYPDAPCFSDIGLADKLAKGGQFIIASANIDPEIAAYIASILPGIMDDPEFLERAATSNNVLDVLDTAAAIEQYNKTFAMYESAYN